MIFSDHLVNELIKQGTYDAFGIPGGVVLKLLAAMKRAEPAFTPHLCYHEQDAGFAALGYAQAGGKLGVAYATRGPGITNMVTCIAEAYQESLPVLFITAHGRRTQDNVRFNQNQELDIVSAVSGFAKFAANAETPDEAAVLLKKAMNIAVSGRKGPVLLDFAAAVFDKEVSVLPEECDAPINNADAAAVCKAAELLSSAKRPLLLIGDGLRYFPKERLREAVDKLGIPVLSSRGSQDLLGGSPNYFGYIGSHGVRYSNFILSKADLIIAVGNRMAFPFDSASFSPIIKNARILRVDIDENELSRKIDRGITCCADAGTFLTELSKNPLLGADYSDWAKICQIIKNTLYEYDITVPVVKLTDLFQKCTDSNYIFVSDVGNNEFWFSRAYEYIRPAGSIVCSKNFGTLGSALGRAIGAHYATHKTVICTIGDQGFQYNLQELQFISANSLPIKIIIMDNQCSGMIYDHESKVLAGKYIHVYKENDYSTPDFKEISQAYGIRFMEDETSVTDALTDVNPLVFRISYSKDERLTPNIPQGKLCQDMEPFIERNLFEALNNF